VIRAVATSAVREARNGDMFLDRIKARTGHRVRNHQRSGGEPPGPSGVRQRLGNLPAFKGAWTLVVEVGGGGVGLTLLRRGRPNRSGVYAVGSVRMRQQLNLKRHSHDLQVSLLKRYVANVIEEIRVDIPLDRVTHLIAIGNEARFSAAQLQTDDAAPARTISREEFLAFAIRLKPSRRRDSSNGSIFRPSKPKHFCRRSWCIGRS
jgi:exopolyphosphatase/guanosine-5'-triphosphate,3'-diphosphate pyrophosphatase